MKLKFNYLALLLVIFLQANTSFGQLSAQFSATPVSGCSPLKVQFNDLSSGSIVYWFWDFGNGNTALNQQNPIATYTVPGKYSVKLHIKNSNGDSSVLTKTQYITVFDNPSADFTALPLSGCKPLSVNFTDLSTPSADGPITQWSWDFGDGTNSSAKNPNHLYTLASNFPVSLIITDVNGCTNKKQISNYIKVSNPPVINFGSASVLKSCKPPLNVQFTNTTVSPDGLTLSYVWKFGDGTTSTLSAPAHNYTQIGNYTVTLVVTDALGCKDSAVLANFVQINSVVAKFSSIATTVCPNAPVQFSNNSSGANSYKWDFGDGKTSTNTNPSHYFKNPGVYPVKLVSTSSSGCKDSVIVNYTVENIVAAFTTDKKKGCTDPLVINYTDQSTGAVSWQYFFGDGKTSNVQNPTHTYNNINGLPIVNYYTEYLIVTNATGCKDTTVYINNITQTLLSASFQPDTNEGCAPLLVNFTDLSTWQDSIVSWSYDFDDGTTSTNQNPTHTFTNEGVYEVELTITNKEGCTFKTKSEIKVGTKQTAEFSVDKTVVCGSDLVTFTDLSSDLNKINEWTWSFGDKQGAVKTNPPSINGNINHTYKDTGYMHVMLIVSYNGCRDTMYKDSLLYVNGPIAEFGDTVNCENTRYIGFVTNLFLAVDRFEWDFGDGSPLETSIQNPKHLYSAPGDYYVKLTTYNDKTGCKYEYTKKVEVRDLIASFTPTPVFGCAPLIVTFNNTSTQNAVGYQWDFGDGNSVAGVKDAIHIFQKGTFKVRLVVFDVNGCSDTAYKFISTYKPAAGFKLDTLIACAPGSITITDTSKTNGTPIVSYSWKFGDGTFSNVANPGKHTYAQPGTYQIRLYIVDQAGCTDSSVSQTITIVKPIANFGVTDQTICKGDSVLFYDFSLGNVPLTHEWTFGDGSSKSSLQNPYHTYTSAGTYQVILKIKDAQGCSDTKIMPNLVSVHDYPKPQFTVDKQNGCSLPGVFTNLSVTPFPGVTYLWNFGDGGVSQAKNPSHQYIIPGTFDVELIVTDTVNGCTDTIVKQDYITIYNSSLTLTSSPATICKGDAITFQISNVNNAIPVFWDFGDGYSLIDSVSQQVSHVYNNMNSGGIITAYLYYTDTTLDVTCKNFQSTQINVRDVIANFGVSNQAGCAPHTVTFNDLSSNPNIWKWTLGDGTSSSLTNPPSHTYNTPGSYTVSLAIENNTWGCKDTIEKTIEVYPLPKVSASNLGPVCLNDSVQLIAQGGERYTWTPIDDFSWIGADTIYNPYVTPKVSTTYYVSITDSNGCVNSTHTDVIVIKFPVSSLVSDTTVIIGSNIVLDTYSNQSGYTYSWTPDNNLSCATCPSTEAEIIDSITYIVVISDTSGCFEITDTVRVHIVKTYAIDLPQVFTPNGDGNNDIVYAKGWGIKKLLEFKIFNRWGEMVFESYDLKDGWDGYYKGVLQNNETYVYILRALSLKGDEISKKGNIGLLR